MPARATLKPLQTSRYGWKPDLPDHRDQIMPSLLSGSGPLPAAVDLRAFCPPVYDQGNLGSCTANAIGAALEFDQIKQKLKGVFVPSRLFIYYNERVIEGTVKQDAGAMIRDGMKTVAQQGAPHETLWPYVITSFAKKPPASVYTDAAKYPALVYRSVPQDITSLKSCLASGFPIVFGFTVYSGFESPDVAKTGQLNLPTPTETVLGGHAVLAVGYDDATQRFLIRNSWGTSWGLQGYFTMPYAYMTNTRLASDFWTITAVKG